MLHGGKQEIIEQSTDYIVRLHKINKFASELLKKCSLFGLLHADQLKTSLDTWTSLPAKDFPLKYLGVPLQGHGLQYKKYNRLMKQLQIFLNRWKGRTLCHTGRLQLGNWTIYVKLY